MRDPVTAPDAASAAQHGAADPSRSTWLTANAGSGKTSVLTDRVARLLLDGTRPERILCLTYTKAAASEMQNRLLKRLGEWAMLDDAALSGRLAAMGIGAEDDLAAARRLFAQAIETPGGLKVQTIHSFCGGVLRRFPLEAGVPHGFAELDDRSAANLRTAIIEDMASDNAPEMADLLALQSDSGLDEFLAGLTDFDAPPDPAALWAICDLPPGFDDAALLADSIGDDGRLIAALIPLLETGSTSDQGAAAKLAAGRWDRLRLKELEILEGVLLTGATTKEPFSAKLTSFPTKALRTGACAPLIDDLTELMSRIEATRPLRLRLAHARRTLALQRFGHAFGTRYAAAKRAGGWLDFDDLITLTARLLDQSAMAQWVLFRLDGGIDHILVDEAQDTSPRQWQVIRRLTDEFTAGASDRARTLFVVGDPKQSIYSFQGADIAVFTERHADFSAAFAAAGAPMQDAALRHSFRSSPAILALTDAVFTDEAAEGLGDPPEHIAFRAAMPGRVELWPPVPDPEKPEPTEWHSPVDTVAANAAPRVLADAVARAAGQIIGQPLPMKDGTVRPARPGDILILVQRRRGIFHDIIRSLKQAGLPVAGADRLRLGGELAVRDIRAVLSVLATPEDDLSLAAALRSPLFGLDEDALYRLAAPRKGLLIAALRDAAKAERERQEVDTIPSVSPHLAAMEMLSDLQGQADFLRPHDLISRLLIRHGGRARLIGRLGPEAEDGIDELLAQALTYEASETPSLTGFLAWLSDDDAEVRRQPGAAGEGEGLIRVMTVHGSKGLESPVVILPDTGARTRPPRGRPTILPDSGPPAHWRPAKAAQIPQVEGWIARDEARQAEERRRLLYVALTRAETALIVAAAGEVGTGLDSWHSMVERGFAGDHRLTETQRDAEWGGQIRVLSFGHWPDAADDAGRPDAGARDPARATDPDSAQAAAIRVKGSAAGTLSAGHAAPDAPPLPGWLTLPAPTIPRPPGPVAATALGGEKLVSGDPAGDAATDRQTALLAGTRLHLLLEHLPDAPRADWPDLARDLLAGAEGGLATDTELAALLAELTDLTDAEALADMFTPPAGALVLREVALSAPLPGGRVLSGAIDRLIVTPDEIRAIDYKSNAVVPATPETAPQGYLRQMAAYRHALRLIYPGRAVSVAILWTRTRALMPLPDPLLDAAFDAAMHDLEPARRGA